MECTELNSPRVLAPWDQVNLKWDKTWKRSSSLPSRCVFSIGKYVQSLQSFSHVWLFGTPWTAAPRLPCPSPAPRAYSNSSPLSRWCHPTISSSVVPFSTCLQSFPASGSFPMNQFFTSRGQRIGILASASVLPMNIQDWFLLGWTSWISLQSKGLSRVFSNTTVKSINSSALSFLYSPALTSIHDHWKNHSFD